MSDGRQRQNFLRDLVALLKTFSFLHSPLFLSIHHTSMRQLHVVDGETLSDEALLEDLMICSIAISESRNSVVLIGAGVSTNAGIPVSSLFTSLRHLLTLRKRIM